MFVRWPRILTPSQLSQILKKQKNPLTALQFFNEARSKYRDYHHNGPVYATMIDILGKAGRFGEMKDLIHQMRNDSCECKDSVFVSAIRTYAKAGLQDEAFSLFKNIPGFNCVNWTESFNAVLQIMVSESRFDDARRLFLENSSRWEVKSRVRSTNLLMLTLCEKGRSDIASQVFQEMDFQGIYPDRESYRILMKGLCQDNRLSDAIHLLYSMFWRISQKGSGEDVVIYRILLESLCENGKFEEAVEILGKILRKGLKAPKRYQIRIDPDMFYNKKEKENIESLINEALLKGGIPSLASYSAMAIDLYTRDKLSEGDKVLKELQDRGFRPTPPIYEAKLAALYRKREINKAVKVLETDMVEANCNPTVELYNIVMKGLCDGGESESAVGYLKKMARKVGCVPNEETYQVLVDGLCRDGKFVEASRVLERMLGKCYWSSAGTYNALITGLCSVGRPYEGVMWLEEMVSQGKSPEQQVWNSLVSSVCCNQMVDFGKSTLERENAALGICS